MLELRFAKLPKMCRSVLIITLLLLCQAGITSASQITVSGMVYNLWDADTVLVVGDIRIPPDNDLTILPGVKVLFDGPWQFQVQQDAKITAVGTPTQRITFKPLHEGDTWRGMRMEMCCGLSILDYCEFEHASVAGTGDSASGGAIYLRKSSLAIYHCTFDSCSAANGGAIACIENSSPLITDGLFLRNRASLGGAIYCGDTSHPIILACDFASNEAEYVGAIYSLYSSPTISQNTFGYNSADQACIMIIGPDTTMRVEGNRILSDSSNAAILINDAGRWSAEIRGNLIKDNMGVAIFAQYASPLIEGNEVLHNREGLYFVNSSSRVSCNVIRDNAERGVSFYDSIRSPTSLLFDHNIIDGNQGSGISGVGGMPVFRNNYITRNGNGIILNYSKATLEHNTISGNVSAFPAGGLISWNGHTTVRHCIITGNIPDSLQAYCNYADSIKFDSCNIPGSGPLGVGNIDIEPQFRDTANGDFHAMSDAIITKPLASCGNEIPDSMEIWIDPTATAVIDHSPLTLPTDFALSQNYPNPFNPSTTIWFSIPYRNHVRLEVFNSLGQLVRTLRDAEYPAGKTSVVWDGTDSRGTSVSSGVYMYRLISDSRTLTRKMLLLK